MKKLFNTLHKYILDHSVKDYTKETVNGLFRTIIEPICSNQKFEALVLLKLENIEGKNSILQRLNFSGAKIVSYCDCLQSQKIDNSEINDIWKNTEFIIVLGRRYSAAMLWDYSLSEEKNKTPVCLLYNSKLITEIAKCISENSNFDFKDYLSEFTPDRRENLVLNKAINNIAEILNDKNEELILKEAEGNSLQDCDETLKTAQTVVEKAKFIAHEIKNNLSIVNLYSTIVKKRLEKFSFDEEVKNSLGNAIRNIENSSEHISYLINDLRCLAKTFISEFNLKDVILNTVSLCEEKAKKTSIEIIVEEVPDIIISADKAKIECAIMNIIFNAIEARKDSGKIVVKTNIDNSSVSIIISNNGKEIPSDIQEKIFEQDFSTKQSGNGVGLAFCKKQLQLTGGDIILLKSTEKETSFEIKVK